MNANRRGEIWWVEAQDKRRAVLVVTRTEAVAAVTGIVGAPVTQSQTVRGIPTEAPCSARRLVLRPAADSALRARGPDRGSRAASRGDLRVLTDPGRPVNLGVLNSGEVALRRPTDPVILFHR